MRQHSGARVPRTPREARRSHLESPRWRRALVSGIRLVPVSLQRQSMPLWSAFFYLQVPRVRGAIVHNLTRLLASDGGPGVSKLHLQAAAFRTFSNYCACVASAYRFYARGEVETAEVRSIGRLRGALRSGRGAILATGHLGNWQLGPPLLGREGFPPLTVVMAEEPNAETQQLEWRLRDRRVRVVYPGRGAFAVLDLRAALARGELVALQMDRSAGQGSIQVPFAGGTAEFAAGPAALARASGAPVVPVFFPVVGGRLRICVERPLDCRASGDRRADCQALTNTLAELYQAYVRSYPDQWYNFYSFWCDEQGAE